MKPRFYLLVALLLLLGMVGVSNAQDFDEWETPTQSEPAPQNPVQKQYADGKVIVVVQSPRHYGHHIGDVMSIEVVIASDPAVSINLDAIQRGMLNPGGSDFELAAPIIITQWHQDGRNITRLQFKVRSWVTVDQWGRPKNNIPFNATFMYALEQLPDGRPNWVPAQTPDFIITTSNTATDSSKDLLPGDLDRKPYPHPNAVLPMRVAGAVLLLIPLGWLCFMVYRRINPPRQIPANERAWMTFDRVFAESDPAVGITYDRTEQIAHALRAYLQIDSVPTDEAELEARLETFFAGDNRQFELVRVAKDALTVLDRALYERPEDETSTIALKTSEARELLAAIERLVPRP